MSAVEREGNTRQPPDTAPGKITLWVSSKISGFGIGKRALYAGTIEPRQE
jgi:hypothetical protein